MSSAVQDGCVKLFHALSAKGFVVRGLCCSKKYDGYLSAAVLPEDRELLEFLPCEKSNDKPEDVEPVTRNKKLTAEELLVLRTTRHMALSDKFVFSGQPLLSVVSRAAPVHHPYTPAPSHGIQPNVRSARADPFAIAPIHAYRVATHARLLVASASTVVTKMSLGNVRLRSPPKRRSVFRVRSTRRVL